LKNKLVLGARGVGSIERRLKTRRTLRMRSSTTFWRMSPQLATCSRFAMRKFTARSCALL